VEKAVFHLRLIHQGTHLVDLYQKFFPKQFRKDRIDYGTAESVLAGYSRFTELVDRHLFPVWELEWTDLMWEDPGYGLSMIPLYCVSNTWFDRMEEGLSILEKTIVSGAGLAEFRDIEFRMPKTHKLDHFGVLPALCKRLKGPMRRLPEMVDIVLCGTMNPFIDCSQEEFYQGE